jgi:hypothetical protein
VDKAFQGFERDRKTKSEKEHAIYECGKYFGSVPAIGITRIRRFSRSQLDVPVMDLSYTIMGRNSP